MTAIHISVARRTRHISKDVYEDGDPGRSGPTWKAAPGFEDLVQKFLRNHVKVEFKTAYFDDSGDQHYDNYDDIKIMVEAIHEFCDVNCTGFWTIHKNYTRHKDYDRSTGQYTYHDTGSGRFKIHFENEADIEVFLKGCSIFNQDAK